MRYKFNFLTWKQLYFALILSSMTLCVMKIFKTSSDLFDQNFITCTTVKNSQEFTHYL